MSLNLGYDDKRRDFWLGMSRLRVDPFRCTLFGRVHDLREI